jgi:hypothetical protein
LGLALIKLSGLPILNRKRETSKLVFLAEHVSANSFLLKKLKDFKAKQVSLDLDPLQ